MDVYLFLFFIYYLLYTRILPILFKEIIFDWRSLEQQTWWALNQIWDGYVRKSLHSRRETSLVCAFVAPKHTQKIFFRQPKHFSFSFLSFRSCFGFFLFFLFCCCWFRYFFNEINMRYFWQNVHIHTRYTVYVIAYTCGSQVPVAVQHSIVSKSRFPYATKILWKVQVNHNWMTRHENQFNWRRKTARVAYFYSPHSNRHIHSHRKSYASPTTIVQWTYFSHRTKWNEYERWLSTTKTKKKKKRKSMTRGCRHNVWHQPNCCWNARKFKKQKNRITSS